MTRPGTAGAPLRVAIVGAGPTGYYAADQLFRQAGLVESRRGPEGGFLLARPAGEISVADVIRAIDGPLAGVSGRRPETLEYEGAAAPLRETWVAVRASLRGILERVTLADLAAGELPEHVVALTKDPDAWSTRR